MNPQMIAELLSMILPLVSSVLSATGTIPVNLQPLVTAASTAIPTLLATLIAGKPASDDELAILGTIQATIAQVDPTLSSADQKGLIEELSIAIADAIEAYDEAKVKEDITVLTPLPENL